MPVAILFPSGAGALTEWTASAGANYAAAGASGGAFVFGISAGLRDRYALDDLPGDAVSVTSVTAHGSLGVFTDGPVCRLVLRLAGAESNGDPFSPLSGGYSTFSHTFAQAPGGLAWTVARVNAVELGPDLVSTLGDDALCDLVWLSVDYTVAASDTPPEPFAEVPFAGTETPSVSFGERPDVAFPFAGTTEVSFGETPEIPFPDSTTANPPEVPLTP